MEIKLPFRANPRYRLKLYFKDGKIENRRASCTKYTMLTLPDDLLTVVCHGLDEAQNICCAHILDGHWKLYDDELLAELTKPMKPVKAPKAPKVKKPVEKPEKVIELPELKVEEPEKLWSETPEQDSK